MVPEVDELLFSMDVGDVSDIVATPLGLHVIEKVGHEQERPASFDEARERILLLLRHERRGKAISDYVEKLKQTARIEITEEPPPAADGSGDAGR